MNEIKEFLEHLDDDALYEIRRRLFRFSVVDEDGKLLVKIPEDVTFKDLDLTHTDFGYVYSRGVIDYIAEYNHVRFTDLDEQIIPFIGAWYRDTLIGGGEHDIVMDHLIREARLADDYPGADDDWFVVLV